MVEDGVQRLADTGRLCQLCARLSGIEPGGGEQGAGLPFVLREIIATKA